MGSLDLQRLKDGFTTLVNQADYNILPAFMLWLDLKLSEYKANGYMFTDAGYTENTWLQYTADVLKQQPAVPTTPTSHRSRPPLYQVTPDKKPVQPGTAIKYENGHHTPPPSAPERDTHSGREAGTRDHAMFVNANKWVVPKRELSSSPCAAESPVQFTLRVPTVPCHFQQNHQPEVASPVAPGSRTPPGPPAADQSLLRRALCSTNGSTQLSEDTDGDRTPPHTPSSDASPSSNICPECGKNLRYRSSYRRHMRLHQGVFSHVCAVCHRKFTRKEHFLRHKCNRRSYLPSRSADHFEPSSLLPSLVDKVLRIEYPSSVTASPDKQSTPVSVSDSSIEAESPEEQDMAEDLSKLGRAPVKTEPSSVVNGQTRPAPVVESRRKRTIPRKVIPPPSDGNCQFVDDLSNDDDDDDDDDFFKLQICEEPTPQPVADSPKHPSAGHETFGDNKAVKKLDAYWEKDDRKSNSWEKDAGKEACWEKEEGKENKVQALFPVPDSTSLLADFPPPNHPFRAMTKMSMEATNKISLDTGEYAVSCFDADKSGAGGGAHAINAFIKVVKQGNYLKLRKQAQMIGDQLCFVCPNCSKVFHRSSNFSRHMRIHRGVYSYVCPTCNRGFFRKEHFQKHKCYRRGMSHIWDRKTKIDMQIEKAAEPVLPPSDHDHDEVAPPGESVSQPVAPPVLTRMLDDAAVSSGYAGAHDYSSLSPDMPCLQANDSDGAIHDRSQVVV